MNRFFRYRIEHVLFWALTIFFHAYTHVFIIEKAGWISFVLELLVRNALLACVIYYHVLVIIPRITRGNNPVQWLGISLLTVVTYTLLKNLHDVYLYGYVIGDAERLSFFHNTLYNFSIALFYLTFATALSLSKQWYQQREQLRKIHLEKLHTELNYLRAQLNPHFLFNAINTIFFQIDKQNTEARESLSKFSDMLRYQLYECNGDSIAIEKEIEYIRNYVELQRLRKDENYHIQFSVSDTIPHFTLPPLLLIPFIENAFKHVSSGSDRMNEIKITLTHTQQKLHLTTHNTIDTQTEPKPAGIGLKNVQRRLELLYPNRHTLEIRKDETVFQVTLTLEL